MNKKLGAFAIFFAVTAVSAVPIFAAGMNDQHQKHSGHPSQAASIRSAMEIARLSTTVMPFDLDRTLHVFEPTPSGGKQSVISKDGDPEQISLIREHLLKEAEAFSRGDFRDPATIHGTAMPGLADLQAAGGRLEVTFEELPEGALLRYTTHDRSITEALHKWFNAQIRDHGDHATVK